jgi:hypothetical protein
LRRCEFARNAIEGAIFCINDNHNRADLFVNDCRFIDNEYAEISNRKSQYVGNDNFFRNNTITPTLWSRSRQNR